MNLLALLLGLAIEHTLTSVFHLREFHWLDGVFDRFWMRIQGAGTPVAVAAVCVFALLLVAPVALVHVFLLTQIGLIAAFVFAVFVLLFCLGPRDLAQEVAAYREAFERGDQAELDALACELLERPADAEEGHPDIERAIYSQANNRIFGVVFWFAVLGPAGAWLFRVLDLMRRRAGAPAAVAAVHRVFAWVPSRLLMAGYAMAGNYEQAVQAWKAPLDRATPASDADLLGRVGAAAAGTDDEDMMVRAQSALDLVVRTLWFIWCPVLGLLTIYGALA